MSRVLAVVEQEAGDPLEASLESLTFACAVTDVVDARLEAIVFGDEGAALVDKLGTHGVHKLHHVRIDEGAGYAPAAWGDIVADIATKGATSAVVAPGSDRGQEVLAHAGAVLDEPMAANCLEVESDGEGLDVTRQRWGGSLVERARLTADTPLLSAAPHEHPIEPVAEGIDPSVTEIQPADPDLRVSIDRFEEADEEGVPLGEARVVVSGGRGVGSAEDFDQLEELADLLGGTVGASRAAVNEGWRPHDDQVGLTGAKISPDIYIACGISGAVQHMVGCKGADNILAINTDPEAAIIQQSEYAVIGDLHEVVPALNEAIKETE